MTPFSTNVFVKNSIVNRYHETETKKNQDENVQKFESLARLELENKFLKHEIQVVKVALEKATFDQEVLAVSLKKSDTKVMKLDITNNRLKKALRDFSEKTNANMLFYEANLRELKDFKASKIAEEKKAKKLEKKARRKSSKKRNQSITKRCQTDHSIFFNI